MKRRLALITIVVAAAAAPIASAPGATAAPATAAKTCSSRYVHAALSWGHKCLAEGQFCKVGNREYVRYGFYCPSSGHLRRK